ncbi:prolyl oligopeptidase family serine peptidase [Streptomyces sp. NPDC094034]|uniref:prolyl oligopeptidase family serine peptidase n=1 Tax=Streptomyces sp. NPDC094034 TaxID=3155309 RepID=UPI003319378B
MARRTRGAILGGSIALCLALAACSTDGGSESSGTTGGPTASTAQCPRPSVTPPSGGAAPGDEAPGDEAPGGAAPGGAPSLPFATSVAPGDTGTSTVITAGGAQIRCGKVAVKAHRDIVYATPSAAGKKTELKLDIQVPATDGRKPLVVYVPGGGFVRADKSGALDQRTYVAEQGYAVASIEYRTTSDRATYEEGVADVKSAIRYLRAHADEYGIDAGKVAVWGESAGGYLAAMVGTTQGVERFDAGDHLDESSDVQAVVDKFGPSDLARIGADFDTAARQANVTPGNSAAAWVYGPGTKKSVTDDPAAVARANPATYADSSDPAFLLFHGSADRLVSPSQTLLLHNALRAKGVDSTRYVLTGADHGDLAFMGAAEAGLPWTTEQAVGIMVRFLGERLRG